MNISRTKVKSASVLTLSGRLDLDAAPKLRQELRDLAAESPRVVVDLDGVSFLDSSGIGALISGLKATRERGGDLRLARVSAQAQYVLKLATLDRILSMHPTVEDAVEALSPAV